MTSCNVACSVDRSVSSLPLAEKVLDEFRETFIDVMDANAVVLNLLYYNIIDGGDEKRLSTTYNPREQNQFLHLCLSKKCTMEALKTVCNVIIKVKGNPKMRALGNNMKRRLETGACVCVGGGGGGGGLGYVLCRCGHVLCVHMLLHFLVRTTSLFRPTLSTIIPQLPKWS